MFREVKIGQAEIMKVLMKQKEFVDIHFIREKVKTAQSSINTSLKKLFDFGEVTRKQVLKDGHHIYQYKIKEGY